MAVVVNQDFQDYLLELVSDPFTVVEDVFIFAADARSYTQGKLFDLGVWNFHNALYAQERLDDYLCPSAAWGCWIPGQVVATGGMMIGFTPLFIATVVPYAGPWAPFTAPVAFALDAYNIYRYFD